MKPCEIAVIVPVHNAAAFLTACTDAIAAENHRCSPHSNAAARISTESNAVPNVS